MVVTWVTNQETTNKTEYTMRIIRNQTLGLIIDIQERLFPHIEHHEALERNVGILLEGIKILKVPVMITEQYRKGLGPTIPGVAKAVNMDEMIEKVAFSCCDEPRFQEKLALTGKKFVIIAGIEAHVCVLQTTLDLLENGYQPVVIEDCVSSRNMNDKEIAIERIKQEGAIVSTCESILFELCRVSRTEEFKAISNLVK
jgi:nicotinamidase-related amidase